MKRPSCHPRLWALINDVCWLVFRLFGVNARPRLPSLDRRDLVWEAHRPWFCLDISGKSPAPVGGPEREEALRRCSSCPITTGHHGADEFRPGHCAAGFIIRAIPIRLGRGLAGSLVLGPYFRTPSTAERYKAVCRWLGISPSENTRWSFGESPILSAGREAELLEFCKRAFGLIRRRHAGLTRGKNRESTAGIRLENIYPPLRLADDFPLHVHGVFLGYWEIGETGTTGAPQSACDLEYIDRGRCLVKMKGGLFNLEQGQAVLILPGQKAKLSAVLPHETFQAISITFVANASLLAGIAGKPLALDTFQQTLLSQLCQIAAPYKEASFRSSEVKLLLIQLLMSAMRSPHTPAPGHPMPAFGRTRQSAMTQDVVRVLDLAAERRVRLRELAERYNTSVRTLERSFKKETGVPPIVYHRRLRIKRAELLLRHSMLSVAQIAERLGFNSQFHFSSIFKRELGMSPTEFTRSSRSIEQQVERGRTLLREKKRTVADTAYHLGFLTPESFVRAFRHYQGVTPAEFVKGGTANSRKPAKVA